MLNNIKLGRPKCPSSGHTSTPRPAQISWRYLQRLGSTSVSYAERIGQDLVTHGFLRLIGNVGNTFANSSKLFYRVATESASRWPVFLKEVDAGQDCTGAPDRWRGVELTVAGTLSASISRIGMS